jgi:hypothetical protein
MITANIFPNIFFPQNSNANIESHIDGAICHNMQMQEIPEKQNKKIQCGKEWKYFLCLARKILGMHIEFVMAFIDKLTRKNYLSICC